MATVLYDTGINPSLIRARRVAVLGFGAQGRAQALNLKDSGVNVVVGLRAGSVSRAPAEAAGLSVAEPAVAVSKADVVVLLVPDEKQPKLYADIIAPGLRKQGALIFAHGFNIHFKRIAPRADLDVILVAPNGIGEQVRAQYLEDHGVPALVAAHQDASGRARELALSYAWAQGHGRAGIIESSFREEAETDLFAEQAVLCGGLTHLIQAAFDTLVQAGYEPEVAYFAWVVANSAPPAIIASASPYWIMRAARPMLCAPVVHAVTQAMFGPFRPNMIDNWPDTMLMIELGT